MSKHDSDLFEFQDSLSNKLVAKFNCCRNQMYDMVCFTSDWKMPSYQRKGNQFSY